MQDNEIEYMIVSDDDGHYYVIKSDQEKDFEYWLECSPYWDGYEGPEFDDNMLNRSISCLRFKNYRIK